MKKTVVLLFTMLLLANIAACGQNAETTWQEQYDLGVRYLSEGNYKEAIIAFTAAIEIDPKRAEAYVGRGDTYVGSGETEDNLTAALADYEVALELDDTIVYAWTASGNIYAELGDYERAISAYTYSLEFDPMQVDVYLRIAECYIPLGNIHAAIDWLQTGILETNSHYLEEQLAQIAYETGDYSAYVTETLISQEDLTIGGKPFYELSIEEAVLLLPETESSMVSDFEGSGMPGGKSYSVTRDDSYWGVNANSSYAIITVQQLDGHDTLSFLQYSDFYNEITIGIETGIRGIVTGDSMESVLKKIGIRADGSKYMADSLLSFYIGADNSIDGGAGWIRAEDSSTQYQDNIYARTVRIGMGDFDCQMDFVDDLLVSIDITPNNY